MAVQLNCIYRADIRVSASLVSDGHRFFARLRSNRWKKEEEGEKEEENSPIFAFPPPFRFSFRLLAPPFCTHLSNSFFHSPTSPRFYPSSLSIACCFDETTFLYSFLLLVKRVDPWPHSLEFSKKKRKGDELLPISLALKPISARPTAFTMRSVGESHGGRVIFENAERTRFDLSATCGRSVCPPPPPPLEATRPPPAKLQHLRHVLLSPRFSPKETTNAQKREKSRMDRSIIIIIGFRSNS